MVALRLVPFFVLVYIAVVVNCCTEKTCYISGTVGNDNVSSNGTATTPYRTIQHGLDVECTNFLLDTTHTIVSGGLELLFSDCLVYSFDMWDRLGVGNTHFTVDLSGNSMFLSAAQNFSASRWEHVKLDTVGQIYITSGIFVNGASTSLSAWESNFWEAEYAMCGGLFRLYNVGLTLDDVTIGDSTAENGGAICTSGFISQVTMTGGTFYNNTASVSGGAIYHARNPTHTMKRTQTSLIAQSSEFSGNVAQTGDGGAFFVGLNNTIALDSCAFFNNVAGLDGGAIFVDDVATDIELEYSDNRVSIMRTIFRNNVATTGNGGAICVMYDDTGEFANVDSTTSPAVWLIIGDSVFCSNIAATGDGGAIAAKNPYIVLSQNNYTLVEASCNSAPTFAPMPVNEEEYVVHNDNTDTSCAENDSCVATLAIWLAEVNSFAGGNKKRAYTSPPARCHISSSGSDLNAGTYLSPWRTIGHCIDMLCYDIRVITGFYDNSFEGANDCGITITNIALKIKCVCEFSNTLGNDPGPNTVRNQYSNACVFDFGANQPGITPCTGASTEGFFLRSLTQARQIEIENIEFRNYEFSGIVPSPILTPIAYDATALFMFRGSGTSVFGISLYFIRCVFSNGNRAVWTDSASLEGRTNTYTMLRGTPTARFGGAVYMSFTLSVIGNAPNPLIQIGSKFTFNEISRPVDLLSQPTYGGGAGYIDIGPFINNEKPGRISIDAVTYNNLAYVPIDSAEYDDFSETICETSGSGGGGWMFVSPDTRITLDQDSVISHNSVYNGIGAGMAFFSPDQIFPASGVMTASGGFGEDPVSCDNRMLNCMDPTLYPGMPILGQTGGAAYAHNGYALSLSFNTGISKTFSTECNTQGGIDAWLPALPCTTAATCVDLDPCTRSALVDDVSSQSCRFGLTDTGATNIVFLVQQAVSTSGTYAPYAVDVPDVFAALNDTLINLLHDQTVTNQLVVFRETEEVLLAHHAIKRKTNNDHVANLFATNALGTQETQYTLNSPGIGIGTVSYPTGGGDLGGALITLNRLADAGNLVADIIIIITDGQTELDSTRGMGVIPSTLNAGIAAWNSKGAVVRMFVTTTAPDVGVLDGGLDSMGGRTQGTDWFAVSTGGIGSVPAWINAMRGQIAANANLLCTGCGAIVGIAPTPTPLYNLDLGNCPFVTPSPTTSQTHTATPTQTSSNTQSRTGTTVPTQTRTPTATNSPSQTSSATSSISIGASPSNTALPSATATQSTTASSTQTQSTTVSATQTPAAGYECAVDNDCAIDDPCASGVCVYGFCEANNVADGTMCMGDELVQDVCVADGECRSGACVFVGVLNCDDGLHCTTDACISPTHGCRNTPVLCPQDDDDLSYARCIEENHGTCKTFKLHRGKPVSVTGIVVLYAIILALLILGGCCCLFYIVPWRRIRYSEWTLSIAIGDGAPGEIYMPANTTETDPELEE